MFEDNTEVNHKNDRKCNDQKKKTKNKQWPTKHWTEN